MFPFKWTRPRAEAIAGGGIFALTLIVLIMLYLRPDLADNDLFKTLAQAIVVQGLVGLAMAYYFTAKPRGGGDVGEGGDDAG